MKMKRVFLKLSGEALAGPKKTGFDEDTVKEVAIQVKLSVDAGVQVGIVIGGGNFWRHPAELLFLLLKPTQKLPDRAYCVIRRRKSLALPVRSVARSLYNVQE